MPINQPQYDNPRSLDGSSDAWEFEVSGAILEDDYFSAPVGGNSGQIKVFTGTIFEAKPVKVWSGSAWVTKTLKRWNGSAWVATNY